MAQIVAKLQGGCEELFYNSPKPNRKDVESSGKTTRGQPLSRFYTRCAIFPLNYLIFNILVCTSIDTKSHIPRRTVSSSSPPIAGPVATGSKVGERPRQNRETHPKCSKTTNRYNSDDQRELQETKIISTNRLKAFYNHEPPITLLRREPFSLFFCSAPFLGHTKCIALCKSMRRCPPITGCRPNREAPTTGFALCPPWPCGCVDNCLQIR